MTACAPLRISLAGGGSDLPEYYARHGCHLLAAAVDLDVQVSVSSLADGVLVNDQGAAHGSAAPYGGKAAEVLGVAQVKRAADLPPSLVRCALDCFRIGSGVRVDIEATCPPGTGLGWSGALAVALAGGAAAWKGQPISPDEAAGIGFRMERAELGRPVGQQDHWVAALGGVTRLVISPSGQVTATREPMLEDALARMLDRTFLLFRTPIRRSAGDLLAHQARRLSGPARSGTAAAAMRVITGMVPAFESALLAGRESDLGALLHEHWTAKVRVSPMASNSMIDEWYLLARQVGAYGGKVVGAGGGGHLLVVCHTDRAHDVDAALGAAGLTRVPIRLRRHGLVVHSATPP